MSESSDKSTTVRHEEYQYLDLVREILDGGEERSDRTGTGTVCVFGRTMRFSLRDGVVPVMTTKRVHWKAVAEELMWFVSGSTDAKKLSAKGVRIWDANAAARNRNQEDDDQEDGSGSGDLGPVYGFQWRHFGAKYVTCDTDYCGQGVDQLQQVLQQLQQEPDSRRIVLCAWNCADQQDMALPPCHCFVQFHVTADRLLNCMLTQRSADCGLGLPFNVASYALLTHLLARAAGLRGAGELFHCIGNAHVYRDHVSALRLQLQRQPRPFPTIRFLKPVHDLDQVTTDDFELVGYDPHPAIKMNMSV